MPADPFEIPTRDQTCAILTSGAVECWGYGSSGRLGNGVNDSLAHGEPSSVAGTAGYTAVTGSEYFTCGLVGEGGVRCWGYASEGWLGNNSTAVVQRIPVDLISR